MLVAEYLAGDVIEIKYTGDGLGNSVDCLTPLDCLNLKRSIDNALFAYKQVTGKFLTGESPGEEKNDR